MAVHCEGDGTMVTIVGDHEWRELSTMDARLHERHEKFSSEVLHSGNLLKKHFPLSSLHFIKPGPGCDLNLADFLIACRL